MCGVAQPREQALSLFAFGRGLGVSSLLLCQVLKHEGAFASTELGQRRLHDLSLLFVGEQRFGVAVGDPFDPAALSGTLSHAQLALALPIRKPQRPAQRRSRWIVVGRVLEHFEQCALRGVLPICPRAQSLCAVPAKDGPQPLEHGVERLGISVRQTSQRRIEVR